MVDNRWNKQTANGTEMCRWWFVIRSWGWGVHGDEGIATPSARERAYQLIALVDVCA